MDAELKAHLEAMEARLEARSEAMEARLEARSEAMEERFHARSGEMEETFRAHTEEMEARLKAHTSLECEKIETKLLREFWKWGSTSDIRTRQSMENANALNERMLNAEDRISALERSRLPPRADAA